MTKAARKRGLRQAAASSAPRTPRSKSSETQVKITIGTTLALILSVFPPCIATAKYSEDEWPTGPVLLAYDILFRNAGPVLFAAPFFLRYLASLSLPSGFHTSTDTRHPFQDVVLHAGLQAARAIVYGFHIAGQRMHVWHVALGSHSGHLLADHVLLGAAVQAGLVVELAAAVHLVRVLCAQRQPGSKTALPLSCFAFVVACVLLVLTGCEMYNTAHFFHPPREVFVALLIGTGLFFPAAFFVVRLHEGDAEAV